MANPSNLAAALLYQQEQNQRRKALVQPQSVEDVVQDTFGMQPGLDRATFLPMAGTRSQKNLQFAAPGIVYDAAKALATPLAAWRGANVTPEDAFNVAGNVMGGGLSASALRPVESGVIGANVYHGTPHRFPATEANPLGEFDASKIGTGEGAQAYGHGVYLAESPKVAHGYATQIPYRNFEKKVSQVYSEFDSPDDAMEALKDAGLSSQELLVVQALQNDDFLGFDYPHQALRAALKEPENFDLSPETKSAIQNLSSLYKADLPDDQIAKMLDWDAPVDEGFASKFMKAVRQNDELDAKDFEDALGLSRSYFGQPEDGRAIYKLLSGSFKSDAKASEFLKDAGIPGIRYFDADSRGSGNGTRNFVVFPGEEKKLKILERN